MEFSLLSLYQVGQIDDICIKSESGYGRHNLLLSYKIISIVYLMLIVSFVLLLFFELYVVRTLGLEEHALNVISLLI